MKNTIPEVKNYLEELSSRVDDTEEQISQQDERLQVIIQDEQIKEKRIKKKENSLRDLRDKSSALTFVL